MIKTYIHFGADEFYPDLLSPEYIRDRSLYDVSFIPSNKPPYGMWASPEDAAVSWKDFCEGDGFNLGSFDKSFRFKIKEGKKILNIKERSDYKDYFTSSADRQDFSDCIHSLTNSQWNMVKLLKDGYSGIEYTYVPCSLTDHLFYFDMYGWDCDSICIWDPDAVEVI